MATMAPLLVVDVQNGFVTNGSRHIVPSVIDVVQRWQRAGGPVYCSKFINDPGSQWERLIGWHRLQSSPETDLVSELADLVGDEGVFEKRSYTSVVGSFLSDLEAQGWDEVVICGIATDGCVLESAVDLFQRDVRPVVLVDACASHAGDEIHNMGLTLLARAIGRDQLLSVDTYLSS